MWKPTHKQLAQLSTRYMMTITYLEEMLEEQCFVCAICREDNKKLVFDHCHETGKARGWLCHRCNLLLGHVENNILLFDAVVLYLIKHGFLTKKLSSYAKHQTRRRTRRTRRTRLLYELTQLSAGELVKLAARYNVFPPHS